MSLPLLPVPRQLGNGTVPKHGIIVPPSLCGDLRFAIPCLGDEKKTSPPLSRNLSLSIVYRDSILLLVQSGLEVALANLPGLFKPSKALLAKVCSRDQEPCRRTLEMFVS